MSERLTGGKPDAYSALANTSGMLRRELQVGIGAENRDDLETPCPFKEKGSLCGAGCGNSLAVTSVNLAIGLMIDQTRLNKTFDVDSIQKAAKRRFEALKRAGEVDEAKCFPVRPDSKD